jgi:hypothetical protein
MSSMRSLRDLGVCYESSLMTDGRPMSCARSVEHAIADESRSDGSRFAPCRRELA